ncbi:MAG: response regulator [Thiohalomonadales bacterium]
MINLLLVEDDERLAGLMQRYLENKDFLVNIESQGDLAVDRILNENPDIVILDIMLPGLSGLDICRQIRPTFSKPIIMLTAMGDDIDQVVGLELGADDYIPKPVEPRLLLARIRAILRRTDNTLITKNDSKDTQIEELTFGDLKICKTSYEVHINNKLINISNLEFELLWLLTSNAGTILSRDQILTSLRGFGYDGQNRSTDIAISRLRKKIGDDQQPPTIIKTIHRKGYLFSIDGTS